MPTGHSRGRSGKFKALGIVVFHRSESRSTDELHRFDLNPQELARFVFDIMTDYEVYFQAHRSRMNAYANHYRDVDAILDANPDVQALGE